MEIKEIKIDYNEGQIIIKIRFSSKLQMLNFRMGWVGGGVLVPLVQTLDPCLVCDSNMV